MNKNEIELVFKDSMNQLKKFLKTADRTKIKDEGYEYIRVELNLPELNYTFQSGHCVITSSLEVYLEDYLIDNGFIPANKSWLKKHSGIDHINLIKCISDDSAISARSNCINRKRTVRHKYRFRCASIYDLSEVYYGSKHACSQISFMGEEDFNQRAYVADIESKSTFTEFMDILMNIYNGLADLDDFDLIVQTFNRTDRYDGTRIDIASSQWEARLETAQNIEKSLSRESDIDALLADEK